MKSIKKSFGIKHLVVVGMLILLTNLAWSSVVSAGNYMDNNFFDEDIRLLDEEFDKQSQKFLGFGDINRDKRDDLIVVNYNGDIRARLTNDQGTLSQSYRYLGNPRKQWGWLLRSAVHSTESWDKSLGCGDVNGDGYDDILIINGHGDIYAIVVEKGTITRPLYLGNPHRAWGWALTSQQGWDKPMGVGNVNRDEFDDIIIINGAGDITALVVEYGAITRFQHLGNPRRDWGWDLSSRQGWDKTMGVGDIDGDQFDDIIIINGNGDIAGIVVEDGAIAGSLYLGNPHRDWGWDITSRFRHDYPLGVGNINGNEFDDIIIRNKGSRHATGIFVRNSAISGNTFMGVIGGPNDDQPFFEKDIFR